MTEYHFVPTTLRHVAELVRDMSPLDRQEVEALTGPNVLEAVAGSVERTPDPRTVLYGEIVLCILGVSRNSIYERKAYPWLVSTTFLRQHSKLFLRGCRRYLREYEDDTLMAWVDARHTIALRWMEWMGFKPGSCKNMGVERRPFVQFVKEAKHGT